jgi:hypothetical protein
MKGARDGECSALYFHYILWGVPRFPGIIHSSLIINHDPFPVQFQLRCYYTDYRRVVPMALKENRLTCCETSVSRSQVAPAGAF